MAENVSVVQPELTREQVSVIVRDPDLRKLRPGSPEYQTALAKKFPSDGTKSAASEPAISGGKTKTNEAPAKVEASDDETIEGIDRNAVSTAVNKKIAKLISERNAEMALRTNLEKRIAELENQGKTPKQAEKQATAEVQTATQFDKPKPKLADFSNIEDYNDAYADWQFDKREFEAQQTSRTKAAQESDKAIFTKFWGEGSKLEKELGLDEGDFKTLIENDGVKKFPSTVRTILESELGTQIAYELANLDEAEKERFGKMTDIRQVAYIGRLEAKLEKKQQATETPAISAAKPPGKPLKKGTGSSVATIASGMSYQDYKAARKAQNPEKFRR